MVLVCFVWVQVGFKLGSGLLCVGSIWVQVGFKFASGLLCVGSIWVQVGFNWGSSWVQLTSTHLLNAQIAVSTDLQSRLENYSALPTTCPKVTQPIYIKIKHPGRCVLSCCSNAFRNIRCFQSCCEPHGGDDRKHDNLHVGTCMHRTRGSNTPFDCQLLKC